MYIENTRQEWQRKVETLYIENTRKELKRKVENDAYRKLQQLGSK